MARLILRNGKVVTNHALNAILFLSLGTSWHRFESVFELEYQIIGSKGRKTSWSVTSFVNNNGSSLYFKEVGLLFHPIHQGPIKAVNSSLHDRWNRGFVR